MAPSHFKLWLCLCVAAFLGASSVASADEAAVQRGAYLAAAGDCTACHTDKKAGGPALAGGKPLVTAFGTFYGPNITPDRATGIGTWSEADFHRALRDGIGKNGQYLYPVFPFTSFTGMTDRDIADLYAYLMSRKPVNRPSHPQEPKFPFNLRFLLVGWRSLFFTPGPLKPVSSQSEAWNRGRYLAETVVHCQECHTPRNFFGALEHSHAFAGNPHGPDGQDAPDITSDDKDGIGKWSASDIVLLLKTGLTPDGDSVGEGMADTVDGTSKLSDADLQAIAIYIKSLPPRPKTPK